MEMLKQSEEECILEHFKDKYMGEFLDIGAHDGVTASVTHALALKGWGGVCVEPSPGPFVELMKLYRNRRDIRLVNAAVQGKRSTSR